MSDLSTVRRAAHQKVIQLLDDGHQEPPETRERYVPNFLVVP